MSLLLALFSATNLRFWLIAGGLVLAVGAFWKVQSDAYERGKADAIAGITTLNNEARSKADEAARTVENCNGRWDRARGVCVPDGQPSR